MIPPFFVTLLESGFTRAAIVVAIVIVINGFVNNAIAPRFMGQRTGLSTLAVFLSLVLWAWILGPIGALMSVPLMLMVKLLFLDYYDSTRPLSAVISPLPRSKEAGKEEPAERRTGPSKNHRRVLWGGMVSRHEAGLSLSERPASSSQVQPRSLRPAPPVPWGSRARTRSRRR